MGWPTKYHEWEVIVTCESCDPVGNIKASTHFGSIYLPCIVDMVINYYKDFL